MSYGDNNRNGQGLDWLNPKDYEQYATDAKPESGNETAPDSQGKSELDWLNPDDYTQYVNPDTPEQKKEDIGTGDFYGQAPEMLMTGVGQFYERLGGALKWAGLETTGEDLGDYGGEIVKDNQYISELRDFEWDDLSTSEGWANFPRLAFEGLLTSAPEMVATLPLGGITGKIGSKFVSAIGSRVAKRLAASGVSTKLAGKTVKKILSKPALQGAGQTFAVGALEGGQVYDDLVESGVSPDKAGDAAQDVLADNMALTLINAPQFAYLFKNKAARKAAKEAMETATKTRRVGMATSKALGNAAGESAEEVFQGASSSAAMEKALGESDQGTISRLFDPEYLSQDQVAQEAVAGFGAGLGLSGAGATYRQIADVSFKGKEGDSSTNVSVKWDMDADPEDQLMQLQSGLMEVQTKRKEAQMAGESTAPYDQAINTVKTEIDNLTQQIENEQPNAQQGNEESDGQEGLQQGASQKTQEEGRDDGQPGDQTDAEGAGSEVSFANNLGETQDLSDVQEGAKAVRVGDTDVVLSENENEVTVESIRTDPEKRGSGSARNAMEQVINEADRQNKKLRLRVAPEDEGVDAGQLQSFYESMGFQQEGDSMVRPPSPSNQWAMNEAQKPISERIGKPVEYKGYKGTLTTDDTGMVVIDTGDQIVEVPEAGKDTNVTMQDAGIKPDAMASRDFVVDGENITIVEQSEDGQFKDRNYTYLQSNFDDSGALVSVQARRDDGEEVTIRDPRIVDEVAFEQYFSQDTDTDMDTEEQSAERKSRAVQEIDNAYSQETIDDAVDSIINTPNKKIDKIFQKLENGEEITAKDKYEVEKFVEQKKLEMGAGDVDLPSEVIERGNAILEEFQNEVQEKFQNPDQATTQDDGDVTRGQSESTPEANAQTEPAAEETVKPLATPPTTPERTPSRIEGYEVAEENGQKQVLRNGKVVGPRSSNFKPVLTGHYEDNYDQENENYRVDRDSENEPSQAEYDGQVAQESENVYEIASTYEDRRQRMTDERDTKEDWIAEEFASGWRITPREYEAMRGEGTLSPNEGVAKKFLMQSEENGNIPDLDTKAEELSSRSGMDISMEDIIDFIDNYNTVTSYYNQKQDDTLTKLGQRFKEITGMDLTPETAQQIADAEASNRLDQVESQAEEDLSQEEFNAQMDELNALEEYYENQLDNVEESAKKEIENEAWDGGYYNDPFYSSNDRVFDTSTSTYIDVTPTKRNIDLLKKGQSLGSEILDNPIEYNGGWKISMGNGQLYSIPYSPKTEKVAKRYHNVMRMSVGLPPLSRQEQQQTREEGNETTAEETTDKKTEESEGNAEPTPPTPSQVEQQITEQQKQIDRLEREVSQTRQRFDQNMQENQTDAFGQNQTQDMFDDRAEQQQRRDEAQNELETAREEIRRLEEELRNAQNREDQSELFDEQNEVEETFTKQELNNAEQHNETELEEYESFVESLEAQAESTDEGSGRAGDSETNRQTDGPESGQPASTQRDDPRPEQDMGGESQLDRNADGRPAIVEVTRGERPTPETYVDKDSYNGGLDEAQQRGVNMALSRRDSGGNGFMLADGTGVGKTRQILALAQEISKDGPVLVVTENQTIIDNNFRKDAQALGIDIDNNPNIILTTYRSLGDGKVPEQNYAAVLYDEAHNLKDATTNKSMAADNLDVDYKVFLTATPMDVPTAAVYFAQEVSGRPEEEIYAELGLTVKRERNKNTGEFETVVEVIEGVSLNQIRQNVIKLRDRMIREGAMLRREYPFYGDISETTIPLTEEQKQEQAEIEAYWDARIEEAKSRRAKMNLGGQKSGDLSKWNEAQKLEATVKKVTDALENGEKVVVISETSGNEVSVSALDRSMPGFLKALSTRLDELGIPHAKIFGRNNKSKANEQFQSGEVDVVLGTARSASTGIDLDDQTGGSPRRMIMVTAPYSGNVFDQILGRVSRRNTKSPANIDIVYTESTSDNRRREIVSEKRRILMAIQRGDHGVDLMDEDMVDLGSTDAPMKRDATPRAVSNYEIVDISSKAFVVKGDTKPIKEKLKSIGAKWHRKQKGWMFPISRKEEVEQFLKDLKHPDKSGPDTMTYTNSIYDTAAGRRLRNRHGEDGKQNPINIGSVIKKIADALGMPIRKGRMVTKADGEYSKKTGVARTKRLFDIEVIAHEGGHKFYGRYNEIVDRLWSQYRDESKKWEAGKEGTPEMKREEGFADMFRFYLMNPEFVKKVSPQLHQAFEGAMMSADPELVSALHGVQDTYTEYVSQSQTSSVESQIVSIEDNNITLLNAIRDGDIKNYMASRMRNAYTNYIDRFNPAKKLRDELIKAIERNTGERVSLKTANDFYKLLRLSVDAFSEGSVSLEHGVRRYNSIEVEGSSLKEALHEAYGKDWTSEKHTEFGTYLAARRLIHKWDQYFEGEGDPNAQVPNRPSQSSKQELLEAIEDYENKHPSFAEAATMVYEYNNALWKKKREAGLISQEEYEDGKQNNPDYVPIQRDVRDKVNKGSGTADGKQNIIKRFTGSDRNIINPVESIMQDAFKTEQMIKRNDAIQQLGRLARQAGEEGGMWAEHIPEKEWKPYVVDATEVLNRMIKDTDWGWQSSRDAYSSFIEELKSHPEGIEDPGKYTLFKTGIINPNGEPIIFYWEDGQRKALRLSDELIGKEVYDMLVNMDKQSSNLITEVSARVANTLRVGVTITPEFAIANLFRDQLAGWVLTDTNLPRQILNTVSGLRSEVSQNDEARLYRSLAGLSTQNVAALDPSRSDREVQRLRENNYVVRRLKSFRAFAEITDLSEISTRIGIFKNQRKKYKDLGYNDYEAAMEAAYLARDYIDFGRSGSKMLVARKVVTFLNAAIQSVDKTVRTVLAEGNMRKAIAYGMTGNMDKMTDQERDLVKIGRRAIYKMSAMGVFGAMLSTLYADDEEYDEINKGYLRATHWMVKEPMSGEWLALPKPYELAWISNSLENIIDAYGSDNPEWKSQWADNMMTILAPPIWPPAAKVPIEIWGNKNTFNEMPIVPYNKLGLEPSRQYTDYTSDFGKWLGKQINVSPAVIDHTVTGFTGSVGRYALSASNAVDPNAPEQEPEDLPVMRRFIKSADRGSYSEQEFWKKMSRDGGGILATYNTYDDIVTTGSVEDGIEYFGKLPEHKKKYVVSRALGADAGLPDHPMKRAQVASSVISKVRDEIRNSATVEPKTKTRLDDLLDRLATVEYRNAMIVAGVPTHKNRSRMSYDKVMRQIEKASPEIHEQIISRFIEARVDPSQDNAHNQWSEIASGIDEETMVEWMQMDAYTRRRKATYRAID